MKKMILGMLAVATLMSVAVATEPVKSVTVSGPTMDVVRMCNTRFDLGGEERAVIFLIHAGADQMLSDQRSKEGRVILENLSRSLSSLDGTSSTTGSFLKSRVASAVSKGRGK